MYVSENKVIIYLLKSKLEEMGIACLIKNEYPPLAGEIPPVMAWPELWVINDDDILLAEQILESEATSKLEKKNKWICPHCNESLEKQFDVCWNCGYGRG